MLREPRIKVKDDILDILDENFNQNTTNRIKNKMGKHWYTIRIALAELLAEGRVENLKLGRYEYWKKLPITEDEELYVQ